MKVVAVWELMVAAISISIFNNDININNAFDVDIII
jgi:hypothetical protein